MDSQNNSSTKLDVYQMVTDRIIELLEADTVPWKKPWTEVGMPMNLVNKRPYRGINLWLLLSLNYEHNLFLTFEQLKALGGSVLKGEKGHIVVFWKNTPKKPEEKDEQGNIKHIPILRYYKVFNVAQCRDIPQGPVSPTVFREYFPIAECEDIVKGMPGCPVIKHKEQRAYYNIAQDFINMPRKKSFTTAESYYCTLFHEMLHSTGHEKRLNRKSITEMREFGSDTYSMEELIAEMGAAYLCSLTGIGDKEIENSAAYISGWLTKLKNDKRFVIQASGQAQKAVDLITNRQGVDTKDEVEEPIEVSVVS